MRQARTARRAGVRIEIQERDEDILVALARFRIARTSDLALYAFPDVRRDTAAVRLRRLFDAGYLDLQVRDRFEENVYALGARGRRWVREHGLPTGRQPKAQAHHLAVVRAWIELAEALATDGIPILRTDPDWELRYRLRGAHAVPDLLVELENRTLLVEVDRGTEPMSVLKSKLTAYRADAVAGLWQRTALVLALESPTEKRIRAIEALLQEHAFTATELMTFPLTTPLAARGGLTAEVVDPVRDGDEHAS